MKLKNFVLLALWVLILSACSTENGTFTEPITMYEKIEGTWNLSRIKQVDELAVANKSGVTEKDLTDYFETFSISLNETSPYVPSTFSTSGAPEILPVAGYWKLDNAFQNWDGRPVKVLFFSDAACSHKTGEVSITFVPGSVPLMELTMTRSTNGTPFVSYVYTLIPVMQTNK